MKEKKEYSRSVRLTQTVKSYVERQPGNGFNEKFENMVLCCMQREPALKKRISEQEKHLKQLDKDISARRSILNDLDSMKWSIKNILDRAAGIANRSEK